jgi:hypothetical protein
VALEVSLRGNCDGKHRLTENVLQFFSVAATWAQRTFALFKMLLAAVVTIRFTLARAACVTLADRHSADVASNCTINLAADLAIAARQFANVATNFTVDLAVIFTLTLAVGPACTLGLPNGFSGTRNCATSEPSAQ